MNLVSMILSGVIFGLTAFLPISGCGHITLMNCIPGIEASPLLMAALELGAVILLILTFRKDFLHTLTEYGKMGKELLLNCGYFFQSTFGKKQVQYYKLVRSGQRKLDCFYLGAVLPSVLWRILLQDVIGVAQRHLNVVGLCFVINGIVLMIADNLNPGEHKAGETSFWRGVICGALTGLAFLPGLSPVAFGITAVLLLGYKKDFAAVIAFFMLIPILLTDFVIRLCTADFSAVGLLESVMIPVAVLIELVIGFITIRCTLLVTKRGKFFFLALMNIVVGIAACLIQYLGS